MYMNSTLFSGEKVEPVVSVIKQGWTHIVKIPLGRISSK
jgi:hypothetical protein